jgi:high frequency lysogenization protein
MSFSQADRTLALAGIVQAAHLVQQFAHHGASSDSAALEACMNSIFQRDAENVAHVYGGVEGVRVGLRLLKSQLDKKTATHDLELAKYVIGVMYLERQLAKRRHMLDRIGEGIENARAQTQHYPVTHANVIANLAGLYSDTISTLMPRIMVNGEQTHLSNPDNANKIRALLLAAIRSAVLWRQCGGSRFKLLFARNAIAREVDYFLTP